MTPRSLPPRSRLRTGEKPSRGPAFWGCRGQHVRKGPPLGLPRTARERSSRRRARRRGHPPSGPVMTTAGPACRPGGVRRLGRAVRGAALSGACLAGVAAVGAVVSSRATYPRPRQDAPGRPAAPPAPAGRIVVAVVLGPRGSVGTDAGSALWHQQGVACRLPRGAGTGQWRLRTVSDHAAASLHDDLVRPKLAEVNAHLPAARAARLRPSRRGRSGFPDFSTPPGPSPGIRGAQLAGVSLRAGDGGRSASSATSHRNGSAENHLRPGNEDLHAGKSGSRPATASRRLSPSARRLDRTIRAIRGGNREQRHSPAAG